MLESYDVMETAVVEKIVRYQKYLEKCMNDDKANAKHVSGNVRSHYTLLITVSLKHDGTDGTGIQCVSPVPSASAAGPSVPSVINSRRKLTNWFANSRTHLTWETGYCQLLCCRPICVLLYGLY